MTLGARDCVLLVAHGTVENLDDLPEFLSRIRHGRPLTNPELVLELRRRYEAVDGSPLLETTRGQAERLAELLQVPVIVGMRLWTPSVEDALRRCAELGRSRVCVLPLAPFSVHVYFAAAQASLAALRAELGERAPELLSVPAWGEAPAFIEAQAANIERAVPSLQDPDTELVLSAHSLPVRAIRSGDPYQALVESCARAIARRLGRDFSMAYQSQGADGGEWLGPDLRAVLEDARRTGKRRVVLAPIGFLADHIETLYDLDIEAAAWARELGLELERVPALNLDPAFIRAMAEVAKQTFENAR